MTLPFDEESSDSIVEALCSMEKTCSLDVADEGETAPKRIGQLLNTSRQMVERVIERGIERARREHSAAQGARQEYPWRR